MPVTGRKGSARGVPMPEAFGLLQGVGGSMPPAGRSVSVDPACVAAA